MNTDNVIHEKDVSFKDPGAIIAMVAVAPMALLLAAFLGYVAYALLRVALEVLLRVLSGAV